MLFFSSLFKPFVCLYIDTCKYIRSEYIKYKINEWKVNILSKNVYLYTIPRERKLEKIEQFEKEKMDIIDLFEIFCFSFSSYKKRIEETFKLS